MSGLETNFDLPESTSFMDSDSLGVGMSSKQAKSSHSDDVSGYTKGKRPTNAPTLQRLLATPCVSTSLTTDLQLPGNAMLITVNPVNNQVFQLIPPLDHDPAALDATVLANMNLCVTEATGADDEEPTLVEVAPHMMLPSVQIPSPPDTDNGSSNVPSWAALLHGCEMIGNYYRGYVNNEIDLETVLTHHKQATHSVWGIRQSPNPSRPSTRLMWKSQYVPFDGIPFINTGSRAVVYECQYGPRRRGTKPHDEPLHSDSKLSRYTQTCPARIYIKRVRKFTAFAVDTTLDKKNLRFAMDSVFKKLRVDGLFDQGEGRYYVQIPTEAAHDYHDSYDNYFISPMKAGSPNTPETSVLHPSLVEHIRLLVAGGETRLYAIRKYLRWLVTHELFPSVSEGPERHNLTYFPTVNCLKNHIHQALRDIETGVLAITSPVVNIEIVTNPSENCESDKPEPSDDIKLNLSKIIDSRMDKESGEPESYDVSLTPAPPVVPGTVTATLETITVTLTQSDEGNDHVISRVETHHSDGSTTVSSMLSEQTAQLLARLHPNMFPNLSSEKAHDVQRDASGSNGTADASSPNDITAPTLDMVDSHNLPATPGTQLGQLESPLILGLDRIVSEPF